MVSALKENKLRDRILSQAFAPLLRRFVHQLNLIWKSKNKLV